MASNVRTSSAVMVQKDGKLLLGIRNKTPDFGAIIIPGGKIEEYETMEAAARREIMEEANIEVKNLRQFRTFEIIKPPDPHRVIIMWDAEYAGGDLRASDDLSDARFYSRDEVKALFNDEYFTKFPRDHFTTIVLRAAGWL